MLVPYTLYVSQTGIVIADLFLKELFSKIYQTPENSIVAGVFRDPEADSFVNKFVSNGYKFTYRSRLRYAFQPTRWKKQTITVSDKGIIVAPELELSKTGLYATDDSIQFKLPNQKSLLILTFKYQPSYYFGIAYIDITSYFLIKRIEILFKYNQKFKKEYELISYDKEYPIKLKNLLSVFTTPTISNLKKEWPFFENLHFDYPNLIVNLNWILFENFFEISNNQVSKTDVQNFFEQLILKPYLKRKKLDKSFTFAKYITEILGYTNKGINSTLKSKLNRLLKRIIIHTSVIAPQFRGINYFPDYYLIVNYLDLESRLYPKNFHKKFLRTIGWSYLIQSMYQFVSNFPDSDIKKLLAFINALVDADNGAYLQKIADAINQFTTEIEFVIINYQKVSKIEFTNTYQMSVLKFVNKIKQIFIKIIKQELDRYYQQLTDMHINKYFDLTSPTLFSEIIDRNYYNYNQMSEADLLNILSFQSV